MYKLLSYTRVLTNPSQAASCRTVYPALPVFFFQSAPLRRRSSHRSTCPQNTAQCSALSPLSSTSLAVTPFSNKFSTLCASPWRTAVHSSDGMTEVARCNPLRLYPMRSSARLVHRHCQSKLPSMSCPQISYGFSHGRPLAKLRLHVSAANRIGNDGGGYSIPAALNDSLNLNQLLSLGR